VIAARAPGKAEARTEVIAVRSVEAAASQRLAGRDESLPWHKVKAVGGIDQSAARKERVETGEFVAIVDPGRVVFVAKAQTEGQIACGLPLVLDKGLPQGRQVNSVDARRRSARSGARNA